GTIAVPVIVRFPVTVIAPLLPVKVPLLALIPIAQLSVAEAPENDQVPPLTLHVPPTVNPPEPGLRLPLCTSIVPVVVTVEAVPFTAPPEEMVSFPMLTLVLIETV